MDRKYTVALASAAAAITVLSLYYYSHKKRSTKESPKPKGDSCKPREEPKEKAAASPDGTYDVSNLKTADEALSKAMSFTTARMYHNAILCYTRGIKLLGTSDPSRRRLLFQNRAQVYFLMQKYSNALNDFTEVISLFPLESNGYINRGEAYAKRGEEEKALRDLTMVSLLEAKSESLPERVQKLISELETSIGSRLAKTELTRRSRDPLYKAPIPSKATCISRLAFYGSERSAAYNAFNMDLKVLTELITSDEPTPELVFSKGDLYLMRGGILKQSQMFKRAAEDFMMAAKPEMQCSQLFNALLETATWLYLCGENRKASELFAKMETLEERGVQANWLNFYSKYACCMVPIDAKKAIQLADMEVEKFPKEAEAHLVRGYVAQTVGNTLQAVNELQKSIEIQPSAYAYITLAACYIQDDIDKGLNLLKKAYELNPQSSDVLCAYGDTLFFKGQYLKAQEMYSQAVETVPDDPQGYVAMARLVMNVGQKDEEAMRYLKMALEKDENCFSAYLAVLQILLMKGRTEEVKGYIEKAMACATGEGNLTEIYGLKTVFEESQRCEKVLEELRKKCTVCYNNEQTTYHI